MKKVIDEIFIDKIKSFYMQSDKKKSWRNIVLGLSAAVVFVTTYVLILPAITLDQETAAEQGGIDVPAVTEELVPAADTDADVEDTGDVVKDSDVSKDSDAVKDNDVSKDKDKDVSKDEEVSKDKDAKADEDTSDAKAKYAFKLDYEGKDFTVTADCSDKAELPESTSLDVTEITKKDEAYKNLYSDTLKALQQEKGGKDISDLEFVKFYDISLVNDGESIDPADPVDIKISYDDAIKVSDKKNVRVVHFAVNNKGEVEPEVLDKKDVDLKMAKSETPKVSEVAFEAASFSVYAVAGTEMITTDYLTADGKTLKVTVNYDENAKIPAGAELKVKEIQDSDKGWGDRSARLAKTLSKNYGNVTLSDARFLSISIMVDGKEFEPKAPVQVKIEYDEPLITEDTRESGYDELLEKEVVPEKKGDRFVAVHYTDEGTDLIESDNTPGDGCFTETIYDVDGFSDYDLAYMYDYDTYEAGDDYDPSAGIHTAAEIGATKAAGAKAAGEALRNAGDVPEHSKNLTDNGNGTYTIDLNVTGDADTESTNASNANVIIIYDVSTSMTYNYIPMATGGRGLDTSSATSFQDGDYFQLYRRNDSGSGYTALTNDNYTGTVYRRTGGGGWGQQYTYTEYTGQRYSYNVYRADAGEKTVYDFTHALFGYQNQQDPTNIQAAFITFADRVYTNTGWTSTESTITNNVYSSGTQHHSMYHNYTNWQGALDAAYTLLNSASTDDDPTYVVFITDGRPQTSGATDARTNYLNTTGVAYNIEQSCKDTDGAFYGIYAYGKEQDWLASLMYYAYNGARPSSEIEGTTFDTEGYYKASDSDSLNQAINEIFQKIVQTLGVTDVSIADGTTSNVATSTGVAHMLDVDTSSFQYWLSIPVTAGSGGTSTFSMPDKTTGDPITYTVTPDGDNVIISWTDVDGNAKSATYAGNVNLNTLTIEWNQSTSFYNFTPPTATFNNGSVAWNLRPVGTLLDGVTYTVTFDCYPSQDTLDTIADLKNGDIEYEDLDPAIRDYLSPDYKLKTNTGATLSYTDTRTEDGPQTSDFTNPDPQPVNATEQVTVSKKWNNSLDGREGWKQNLDLYVTRDGAEVHAVNLTRDNNWTGSAWISYGILTEDGNGVHLKTTGHDYSFAEDVETGYNWEIKAPTVRPMLINNEITLLKLVDAADAPAAITGATEANAKASVGGDTYYKLTIGEEVKYYVVVPDADAALTATNHRRSYLDVVKTVTGGNVPEGDAFEFTMTVNNANAGTADPEDVNSDAWVWFSIWDTINNRQVTDPDAATASGMRWQLNDDPDNGTVVTEKPAAEDFNGYFCVPSGTQITANMQNGYSLRFLNLPEETTYEISESATMPSDQYSFVSIAGTRSYDEDMDPDTTDDWKTDPAGTVSGQSISGTIEYVESAYKVAVTNKVNTIDVKLKKVDENGKILDGSTFTLTSGETTVGTFSPSTTGDGNPIDLGGLGIGTYKLVESDSPTNYDKADDVYFQIYKDTDGSLKARLVDSGGNVLSDQSAITSAQGTDGLIYTITVQDTLKKAKVKVIKNVEGSESDQSKEFNFTITGVSASAVTKKLVGDITADNHSVTYDDITYGTSITVEETADDSFTTTYSVNGAEATTGTSTTFVVNDETVNEDGVAEVVFTNTRSSQLIRVFKYETGTNPEKALDGAEFSLTGPQGSGIAYTGTTATDGYLVCDGKKLIELPAGEYTLKETKAPDGYRPIGDDVTLTVTKDNVVGAVKETITVDDVQLTVYTIKVQNSAGVELPNSGGPGTTWIYLIGIILLIGSAIALVARRRTSML